MDTAQAANDLNTTPLARHPWVTRRLLNVSEYHRMGEAGILTEDDRVELIEGELVVMSPIGSPHAGTINILTELLAEAARRRAIVSVQNPVRLNDRSEPQPDVALLRWRDDRYRRSPPGPVDTLLLIEVASRSLAYDRTIKVPLYAQHAIPELWIVDLDAEIVEVYRDPVREGYASVKKLGREAALEPLNLTGATIAVATLFV